MGQHNGHGPQELNFELDLLPIISMMSVCICFLLLTAVWSHIGTLNIEQGLGQESSRSEATQPSLWVSITDSEVSMSVKDGGEIPQDYRHKVFNSPSRQIDWNAIEAFTASLKQTMPQLQTVLIMPAESVNYGDVIALMDRFKLSKFTEIGVAPLE